MSKEEFKKIPAIDTLLKHPEIKSLILVYGSDLTKYILRDIISNVRESVRNNKSAPPTGKIVQLVADSIISLTRSPVKQIINATGVILHTNLGRAPLGSDLFKEVLPLITGYTNLEIDLDTGKRRRRGDHVRKVMCYLTGAQDALVVNNNAAAVSLILRTFAEKKEVIISRGELIEIGGSFRLPEIMKASGVKIIEVGTTNRTSIDDYENAITKNTRIILKAYRSNYSITGFTDEVLPARLTEVCKKHNLLFIYDIGSGNLGLFKSEILQAEPSVSQAVKYGPDLVTFSCDKLMGGPQAGIIAGKSELISKLNKSPLMRTYRVDKITLALLSALLKMYLNKNDFKKKIPVNFLFNRSLKEKKSLANHLQTELNKRGISSSLISSEGFGGGGTLPDYKIKSFALKLTHANEIKISAQKIYNELLKADLPVLSILRQGCIYFDILTIFENEVELLADSVKKVYEKLHIR